MPIHSEKGEKFQFTICRINTKRKRSKKRKEEGKIQSILFNVLSQKQVHTNSFYMERILPKIMSQKRSHANYKKSPF